MSVAWWRSVAAVMAVVALLEAVRWTVLPYPLTGQVLAVSSLVTVAALAAVFWAVRRWRAARARELAKVQAELQQAVAELARSEQLVAAGAITVPLCADLAELVDRLRQGGESHEMVEQVGALLHRFEGLAEASRRAMRPVDLAALLEREVSGLAADRPVEYSVMRPAEPVWVRANPERLALAARHFLTHAADTSSDQRVLVVLSATDTSAAVVVASELSDQPQGDEPAPLSWSIARAALAECGGAVDALDEGQGLVLRLKLPRCAAPRRKRLRRRPGAGGAAAATLVP